MASTIATAMTKGAPLADRALLASVRDGDRAARDALARRVGSSAYVFALQLTGGSETARDIAQDAVLRFFEHLDRFDADRPVEPWLYQIVRNRVRDVSRRERFRRTESLDAWLEFERTETVDPSAGPAVEAEQSDLRRRVWLAISELTDAHREIIVLRDYHDLSYREIAGVLSIPPGTVMSRLHAARRSLQDVIAAAGDSFPDRPYARRRSR